MKVGGMWRQQLGYEIFRTFERKIIDLYMRQNRTEETEMQQRLANRLTQTVREGRAGGINENGWESDAASDAPNI